jgi:hypothetical protein
MFEQGDEIIPAIGERDVEGQREQAGKALKARRGCATLFSKAGEGVSVP